MITKKLQLISLILGMIILFGSSTGTAVTLDANDDNVTLSTDKFTVKIVGGTNVPMYQFWDTNDDTTKYKLQFAQMFEAEDNQESGSQGVFDLGEDKKLTQTSIALASLTWEFSEFDNESDGSVHFDITSSDGKIQFVNHLYADQDDSLKFDVVLNDYQFSSTETILVLAFTLLTQTGDDESPSDANQDGDTVNFDDGFFQSEETATANGETINVGLSTGNDEDSTMIYLAYGQFNGDLVHDPTVGVQASANSPDGDDGDGGPNLADASDKTFLLWDEGISREGVGMTTFVASFFAVIIPVVLYRRKQ